MTFCLLKNKNIKAVFGLPSQWSLHVAAQILTSASLSLRKCVAPHVRRREINDACLERALQPNLHEHQRAGAMEKRRNWRKISEPSSKGWQHRQGIRLAGKVFKGGYLYKTNHVLSFSFLPSLGGTITSWASLSVGFSGDFCVFSPTVYICSIWLPHIRAMYLAGPHAEGRQRD